MQFTPIYDFPSVLGNEKKEELEVVKWVLDNKTFVVNSVRHAARRLHENPDDMYSDFIAELTNKNIDYDESYADKAQYEEYGAGRYALTLLKYYVKGLTTKQAIDGKNNKIPLGIYNSDDYEDMPLNTISHNALGTEEDHYERFDNESTIPDILKRIRHYEKTEGVDLINYLKYTTMMIETKHLTSDHPDRVYKADVAFYCGMEVGKFGAFEKKLQTGTDPYDEAMREITRELVKTIGDAHLTIMDIASMKNQGLYEL